MPVVEFKRKTLEKLVGKEITDKDIEHKIPMIGCDIEDYNKETVRYEVFPDRPDMLSEERFARALRYFLGKDQGLPEYDIKKGNIQLKTEKVEARPYVTGAVIRNVKLTDEILRSLMQLQEKLHTTLGRQRRKLAIGIHDLDKVEPPFTYKAVDPDEFKFTPLGWNQELTLKQIQERHEKGEYADILEGNDKWPVITDSEDYTLSFPPVINGKKTEVTEETTDLFIDVTGTDQETIEKALNIVVTTLAEREGQIETIKVEGKGERPDLSPETMKIDRKYVNNLLGSSFIDEKLQELLEGMGFEYKDSRVKIPAYRCDIMHPIDIVEEVAIRYRYDEFKPELPEVSTIAEPHEESEYEEVIKQLMAGFGYQEVMNTVLTSEERQFKKMNWEEKELVELENPLDVDHGICRVNALPQLLETLKENQHQSYPQEIFEVARCVELDQEKESGVKMKTKLTAAKANTEVNYNEITSLLDSFLNNLGIEYELKETDDSAFIEGRRAKIIYRDEEIGVAGEITPEVLRNWRLEKPVIAMELDLDRLRENN